MSGERRKQIVNKNCQAHKAAWHMSRLPSKEACVLQNKILGVDSNKKSFAIVCCLKRFFFKKKKKKTCTPRLISMKSTKRSYMMM